MADEAVKLVGFFAQEMGLFFQHIHAATAKYNETGELPSSLFSAKQVKSLDKHARAGEKRKDKIKRKPTAFNYYVKEKLDEFKQKGIKVDEENSNNTLFKMAVTEWTKLSDDEKKAYSAKYAAELLGGEEESDSSDDDNSPKKRKL